MKTIKKVFKIVAFAFIALLVVSVFVGFMFSKQIGNRVLAQVKKELTTEMDVEDFSIELFSGFPNASLNFKDVVIKDTNGENLLETKKIAFRFGMLSLLDPNIDVKSILIDDGALFIHYDRKGRPNYQVIKSSPKSKKSSGNKGLSIKKAMLSDIEVIYENEQSKQEARGTIEEASFAGLVSSSKFKVTSKAEIKMAFVESKTERFFAGTDIAYDANIMVDLDKGIYTFKKCNVFLANSEFDVKGNIKTNAKGSLFDLSVEGKNGSISSVFQLLSEEQQARLEGIKTKGKFYVDGTIKGRLTAKKNPDVKIKFGIKKGKLYGGRLAQPIEDFSFRGEYIALGKKSRLWLKDIKGYSNDHSFGGELLIKNLDDPYIDCGFKGAVPIALIYGFLGDNPAVTGQGELAVKDFNLQGYYRDMINPRKVHRVKANGEIIVDDAGFLVKDHEIIMDKGRLVFDENKLKLEDIKIDGIGQEVLLTGYVKDFIPVFFADSVNSQKAQLDFLLNIEAKELDLQAIMTVLVPESEENKKEASVANQEDIDLSFATYMRGDFKADIDAFSYGDIEGKNFEGKVSFRGVEVNITGDADAMGGQFSIEGEGYLLDKPTLKTFLVLEDVDVRQFFKQTHNFGQEFLTYKSLKGRLNSRMIIDVSWNEKGIFEDKKMQVLAEMGIANGELVNFAMMDNFASFVKVRDLRHIKFTELENWMEIKKGKVYIPTMFIQSNAANLLVSGQHSFDQKISYNIKVNAGQIIANKFKKHDPKLLPQKAKKKGWFNLYYTIKGTTDDFDYRTDKRSVKKSFAREENRKRRIRRVLNKEFGSSKSVSIASHSSSQITPINESEDYLPEITPTVSTGRPIKNKPKPLKTKPSTKPKPEKKASDGEYMEFDEEI
ncbi:MAG TPA: hypothetical protein ENK85_12770 [Saprospiraceae bacterium]|nr:hypothetical protein [Saprospiraceae bacterium]